MEMTSLKNISLNMQRDATICLLAESDENKLGV